MSRRILQWTSLCLSLVVLGVFSEPPRKRHQGQHQQPLLPRVEVIKIFASPVLHLVVDYFWIRTSHAVGAAVTAEQHRDIYLWADLVTDLDPNFHQAYVFAGASLPLRLGRGEWANIRESTQILEKGRRVLPNDYFLRILLAYNVAFFEKDFAKAAKIIEEASAIPGAPQYLAPMATRLYARAHDFDAGLELARSLAESTADPELRETFEQRALQIQLERELVRVDLAAERYEEREGRLPDSVEALVEAGDLLGAPEDPLGGNIYLDAEGRARSTSEERRLTEFATEEEQL